MPARLEAAAMEPRPFIALLPVAARTAPVLDRAPAAAGNALQLGFLAFAVLLAALSSGAFAQQPAVTMAAASELPDAPGAGARGDGLASEASTDPASAGISGTVLDNGGDVIPGARVKLISQTRPSERSVLSGSNGEFAFSQLPPDTYQVTVTAANMGSYASPEIALHAGDQQLVSKIALPLSLAATSIRVYADRNEIAQEQVRLALDQRVMGILPNFYSSYDWNAPAMGAKQKFQLAFRSVTDPVAFMGAGALAGAQQSRNSFPGYGQGCRATPSATARPMPATSQEGC